MVLPIETAQEFAMTAALAEWQSMNGDGEIRLPLEYARELPWGWIFEVSADNNDDERYSGFRVSVDRFSGKTKIISEKYNANDNFPLLELKLKSIGPEPNSVFQLICELTGWNATDTIQKIQDLPFVVAVGPMMQIHPINEALLARRAVTTIERRRE